MPEQFIKPLLIIIALSMLVWILFRIRFELKNNHHNNETSSLKPEFTLFLFYIYSIIVFTLTIFPLEFGRFKMPVNGGINLIPLINTIGGLIRTFSPQKGITTEHTLENIFGNIILFIPLGIFLPLLFSTYRSKKKVITCVIMCSASIEMIQLFSRLFDVYRFVDIDDVILNTSGAMLGFIIANKIFFSSFRSQF